MTRKKETKIDVEDQTSAQQTASEDRDDETAEEELSPVQEAQGLEEKLATVENELRDTYDRLLRVSAESENFKKRITRETEDFKKYANESLIAALLPIVDNLERAINAFRENHSDQAALLEGVSLTHAEILKVLEKFSVTSIDAVGLPFDPNFHEAVMQQPSQGHPENTVVRELQKGYMMHNRLIRPSMVVVSKKE